MLNVLLSLEWFDEILLHLNNNKNPLFRLWRLYQGIWIFSCIGIVVDSITTYHLY